MERLGGSVSTHGEYPGWEYMPQSSLRDLMVQVFTDQYGYAPKVEAIHAGLECGLFSAKLPGLDCVSYGPDLKEIHTFRESMSVASVQRVYAMWWRPSSVCIDPVCPCPVPGQNPGHPRVYRDKISHK